MIDFNNIDNFECEESVEKDNIRRNGEEANLNLSFNNEEVNLNRFCEEKQIWGKKRKSNKKTENDESGDKIEKENSEIFKEGDNLEMEEIKVTNNKNDGFTNTIFYDEPNSFVLDYKEQHTNKQLNEPPQQKNLTLSSLALENFMSIKGFNQFEFDLESKERKYSLDLEKGKNYFKYRYISDKLFTIKNNNANTANNNDFKQTLTSNLSIPNNFYSNADSAKLIPDNNLINKVNKNPINLINSLNSRKSFTISHAPGDKHVIKLNALYLQKLEKSIFLFNLKKYENSFNYLKENGIIKSEEEFAELILITQGFDKSIIGEFLSKEKFPNKEYRILKCYMNKIDFRGSKFADALRFLLSRTNLPQDSSLILKIIEVFSDAFFEDNQNAGFKDSLAIYLLTSTVLALNTTFTRTDIKTIRYISKEDFINWNTNVERHILESTYEDIKGNKLDIVHDYSELFYKRQRVKGDEKDIIVSSEGINNNNNNNDKLSQKFKEENANENEFKFSFEDKENDINNSNYCKVNGVEGEFLLSELKKGEVFTKYGKYGDPHPRFIRLTGDESKLTWGQISICSKLIHKSKSINVLDINEVYVGSSSKIFEKYQIPPDFDRFCFSIESSQRTLDLRKDDEKICKKWYRALKYLILKNIQKRRKTLMVKHFGDNFDFHLQNNGNKQIFDNTITEYIDEIVSNIWKNEILPKWKTFRKYITLEKDFSIPFSLFTKRKKYFVEKLKDFKKFEKFLDEKEKCDFIFFYTSYGIPSWLRKKLWLILIGNSINTSEVLFNKRLKQLERVHFVFCPESSSFEGMLFLDNPCRNFKDPVREEMAQQTEYTIREILSDVSKCYKKFRQQIEAKEYDECLFKEDLYRILRIFTLERLDITYSKQLAYFACLFLLNSDNFYNAYVMLINFICVKAQFLLKFFTRDEIFIKTRLDFFEKHFKTCIGKQWKHFRSLDISLSLFFYDWFEFSFIKCFNTSAETFNFFLKLFDVFLIKGEVFLMEIGLSIIKMQGKDLLNFSVKETLTHLKKFSLFNKGKITEDEFWDKLNEINIVEAFTNLKNENKLAYEKGLLWESLLNY